MRICNRYKSNLFIDKGATIWIVVDLKCKVYNSNEYINIDKYSKGKIIKRYSYKYSIVKLDNGRIIKINKKYILINLADIMQKQVVYSITNATSAIYSINKNDIPEVTGKILYPNIILWYSARKLVIYLK